MKNFRYFLLTFFVLFQSAVFAEDAEKEVVAPQAPPSELISPRATLVMFLEAMNDAKAGEKARVEDAIKALDLSAINALVRRERGPTLAWQMIEVFDRTGGISATSVPEETELSAIDVRRFKQGVVRLQKQTDGRWLFDTRSIEIIPKVFTALEEKQPQSGSGNASYLPWEIRLQRAMPASLKHEVFLIENWRWLALLIVITLGVVFDWFMTRFLRRALRNWIARQKRDEYQDIENQDNRLRPVGLVLMAAVWWIGIHAIGLPETALLILLVAVKAFASFAAVWAAYRFVDILSAWLLCKAKVTDTTIDDVLVPLIPRTLKIFVTVIGIVFIADNLSIDITGLLAGLGLGGLAFALAAKDMVQNLFGSITVLMDRTFTKGDWIVVEGVEGTVEHMGFRSTRIRTFYDSLITVPNAKFITAEVDNMRARARRRYKTAFSLTYDTPPEKIEAFCEGVRELIRQHPYMVKDRFHVYLHELGGSGLDILINVFFETPDTPTEYRERHRFLLDCLRIAKEIGVEYAFPTQTLYMRQEEWAVPADDLPLSAAAQQGKDKAVKIVSETTGLGVKPPPVSFD
jgi:MscS family membrane protein